MSETKQRPADMSAEELEALIVKVVDKQLKDHAKQLPNRWRSGAEFAQSLYENLIRTAPGVPSALEMLLEERDQWNKGL